MSRNIYNCICPGSVCVGCYVLDDGGWFQSRKKELPRAQRSQFSPVDARFTSYVIGDLRNAMDWSKPQLVTNTTGVLHREMWTYEERLHLRKSIFQ